MRIFRIIPILAIACLAFAPSTQAVTKLYTEYIVSTNGTILYTGETGRGASVGITYLRDDIEKAQYVTTYNDCFNYHLTGLGGTNYYALATPFKILSWVDASIVTQQLTYVRSVADSDRTAYIYEKKDSLYGYWYDYDMFELTKDAVGICETNGLDALILSNRLDKVYDFWGASGNFYDPDNPLHPIGWQDFRIDYECTLCYTNTFGAESFSQTVTNKATVATNTFSRTGYTFNCWKGSVPKDSSNYDYNPGDEITNLKNDVTFTAQWTANQYTVTLDHQGGSSGTSGVTATYDAGMPSISKPTLTGYTFAGYFDGNGTQYYDANGSSVRNWDVANDTTTLYADWTPIPYTFSFSLNNGDTRQSEGSEYNVWQRVLAPDSGKTGYTFVGWTASGFDTSTAIYSIVWGVAEPMDSEPFVVPVDANGSVSFCQMATKKDATISLSAIWTPNTYTVALDPQSGSGGSDSVTATYDTSMPTNSVVMPTRTGYKFEGYYDATSDGTKYYNADGTSAKKWDKTTAATLYARWTANKYDVTLDRQDDSGNWNNITATYDAPMPSISKPSRAGYTFDGYFDVSGAQYYDANGASAKIWDKASATTLYAYWTPKTYTVSLDPQFGNGGTSSVTAKYNAAMPSATMPTRDGFTFGGYFTGTNGSGAKYYNADGTSANDWKLDYNTTLFAKWTVNEYDVTLDMQGGSGGTSSVQITYGYAMPSISKPSRTGYTFGGYYNGTNGSGTQYYNESGYGVKSWDIPNTTTLYAKWTANTYTVTLNQQSGSNGTEKVFATYDAAMPDATKPDREGYVFGGYFTSTNGLGKKYYNADMSSATNWNIASDTTLYAQWTESPEFYITFVDSDTNAFVNVTYTNGLEYAWLPLMTREGYDFAGWWTSTEPTNRVQQVITDIATNSITTLYARWKKSRPTVTISAGGEEHPVPWGSEFSDVVGAFVATNAAGKTFAWWCCDGKPVQDDFIVTNSMTLTPQYTIKEFSDIVGIPELAFDTDMDSRWCASNSTKTLHSGTLGKTSLVSSRLIAYLKSPGSINFDYEAYVYKEGDKACFYVYNDNGAINSHIRISSVTNGTDGVTAVSNVYWQVRNNSSPKKENHAILSNIKYQPDIPDWVSEWSSTNSPSLKLVTTNEPGVLTFKYRVSGETGYIATNGAPVFCDYLKFSELGGGETLRLEGFMATNEFVEVAITNTTAEAHTFVWRYVKDYDVKAGDDAAWVTDIVWTPLASTIEYKYTKPDGKVAKKSLSVPNDWVDQYRLMDITSATDYLSALTNSFGKIGFDGSSLPYWADYIAGTDPTNAASVFSVTNFTISADGSISIEWSPNLTDRAYTIFGKTNLVDALWTSPTNSAHRFFRVEVSLP